MGTGGNVVILGVDGVLGRSGLLQLEKQGLLGSDSKLQVIPRKADVRILSPPLMPIGFTLTDPNKAQ